MKKHPEAADIWFSKWIFIHEAGDSRRTPQQAWTLGEDCQGRRYRFGDETI